MIPRGGVSRAMSGCGQFREVDWTWRHLVAAGRRRLAARRRTLADHRLRPGTGRVAENSAGMFACTTAGRPAPCGRWSRGQRIYLRAAVAPDRAGVACLDGKTGRRLWLRDCGGTAASDPLWYRGRLFVLTIGPGTARRRTVRRAAVPRGVASRDRRRAFQAADRGDGRARELARRMPGLLGRQSSRRAGGGKRDRDRPARADRSGSARKRLCPMPKTPPSFTSIASRRSNPRDGSLSSSREAARSIALPWRPASAVGGAASSACNRSSICRTTGSWRGPRGDSSP